MDDAYYARLASQRPNDGIQSLFCGVGMIDSAAAGAQSIARDSFRFQRQVTSIQSHTSQASTARGLQKTPPPKSEPECHSSTRRYTRRLNTCTSTTRPRRRLHRPNPLPIPAAAQRLSQARHCRLRRRASRRIRATPARQARRRRASLTRRPLTRYRRRTRGGYPRS